jgi:hypothetical protein
VLLTNHVLSGALIGVRAPGPASAFVAGFGSHFVLDAVPHWGQWGSQRKFLRVAMADGLVSLGVMAAFAAVSPPSRRLTVLAGMTGAALPDIDKPTRMWFGWSPFPPALDHFHSAIQDEAPRRAHVEGLAAAAFAAAALTRLRRPRKLIRPRQLIRRRPASRAAAP